MERPSQRYRNRYCPAVWRGRGNCAIGRLGVVRTPEKKAPSGVGWEWRRELWVIYFTPSSSNWKKSALSAWPSSPIRPFRALERFASSRRVALQVPGSGSEPPSGLSRPSAALSFRVYAGNRFQPIVGNQIVTGIEARYFSRGAVIHYTSKPRIVYVRVCDHLGIDPDVINLHG